MPIRKKIAPAALRVIERLHKAGYEAFLVGGAVRDLILDRDPKDYDIATNATPEEIKKTFGRRSRIIGRRFKLVHVYADRSVYEVSTFRREPTLEERKGREDDEGLIVWRDNEYGTLEQDATRRDFTVNALYYDPLNDAHEFADFVGGLEDMEDKVVRTIGDPKIRLSEDPVRMLRALKLVGQYDFELEPELKQAIVENAHKISLSSQARLLEELYKILRRPWSLPILEACQQYGLLEHLLPVLAEGWDTDAGKKAQHLLKVRDKFLDDNAIFPSRISGICAMMLPFVAEKFKAHRKGELWQNFAGVDKQIQNYVKEFLGPYLVPRYIVAKIRDVLLIQPKLISARNRKRVLRHPEYNRARDLLNITVEAFGLEKRLLDYWPVQQNNKKRGRKRL